MRTANRSFGAALGSALAVALLLLALTPAAAQTPSEERPPLQPLDPDELGAPDGGLDPTLVPRLTDPDRRVTVMLAMQGRAVAAEQGRALERGVRMQADDRQELRAALRAQQDALLGDLERLDAIVLSQLQDAYNGIRVSVPAGALPELLGLPGVQGIEPVATYRVSNATSVPFLGVPEVWEALELTGDGISIGVIDTGIDYTHADFGGTGTEDAFEANDPAVVEEGSFPTAKVVGGYDFVGDAYNASSDELAVQIPNPDPDPLDCNGHGSHVSGTAAGLGVTADGATYEGPYGPGAYEDAAFRIGPGTAPEAELHALKVFGCSGSTNATIDAVEYAVRNDLDVLNLSLGSPYGTSDDTLAVALDNAASAGVIVVAAAGNDGPGPYITGAPASGSAVVSVAAIDSIATIPVADLVSGGDVVVDDLQNSNGVDLSGSVTGEIVVLEDDPATPDVDESLGCEESDFDDVGEGDIVVTFRGTCPRVDRAVFGQLAGVEAVVFVNNVEGPPPVEGVIPDVRIPFLGATPEQGEQVVALEGQTVTIVDDGTVDNPEFRRPAGFTSGGPRVDDSALKPDIAAPGVGIDSAFVGSGDQGLRLSGTSMASPHVAGVAALLRQALPDAPVPQLKARLVNTADPEGVVDYDTLRTGSGLVDPSEALQTEAFAFDDREAVNVNFGFRQTSGPVSATRTVRVRNDGDTPVTYAIGVEADSDADGTAQVQVVPDEVTVPAGAQRQVRVSVVAQVPDSPPADFLTAAGTLVFEPVEEGRVTLRVPYLLVPDVTSRLRARPPAVRLPDEPTTVELEVTNRSPVPGVVDVFAWGIADGPDDPPILNAPDLQHVGVQAFPDQDPFPADDERGGVGVFAVAVADRLSQPALSEFDVLLDVDEDGTHDFAVVGLDATLGVSGVPGGRLGSITVDLRPDEEGNPRNSIVAVFLADAGYNTSVVRLPFVLSDVGITEENPDFTYTAATFGLRGEGIDFGSLEGSFNAFDQPVTSGQFAAVPGNGSVTVPGTIDPEQVAQTPVLGWLLVYPDDLAGLPQIDTVRLVGVPRRAAPPPAPPIAGPPDDGPAPPGAAPGGRSLPTPADPTVLTGAAAR